MSKIILDFGSGNTCKNSTATIAWMYEGIKEIMTDKHEVIVKWQLFTDNKRNRPLTPECFDFAYKYGHKLGFEVTASVFDSDSLFFLLDFDVPFVKIANDRRLDYLTQYVPPSIPIYISSDKWIELEIENEIEYFYCVSKYPAKVKDYEILCAYEGCNISDHTTDFTLFKKYKPKIIEWHYKLKDSTGLDSGSFARTPEQLEKIFREVK